MLRSPAPKRDERGAIAVMYAMLLLFVLIPVAALGVDLGNAVPGGPATQTQADFSAYAGSDHMTGSETAGGTPTTVLVDAVVGLDERQPAPGRLGHCWRDGAAPTASRRRAHQRQPRRRRGAVPLRWPGKVTAPANLVKFGLAGVLGFNQTTVGASATVMVKSPGLRVLPMFAVDGCDYGRQTLTDPAHVPRGQCRADPRLRRRYQPHGAEPGVWPALRQQRQHHTDPQPDGELDRQRNLLQRDQVEGHRQGGVLPRGPRRARSSRTPSACRRQPATSLPSRRTTTERSASRSPTSVAQTAGHLVRPGVERHVQPQHYQRLVRQDQSRSRSVSASPSSSASPAPWTATSARCSSRTTDAFGQPARQHHGGARAAPDTGHPPHSGGQRPLHHGVNGAVESSETDDLKAEQQLRRHRHRPDGERRHPGLHHGCDVVARACSRAPAPTRTARPTTTGTSAGSTWVPVPTST